MNFIFSNSDELLEKAQKENLYIKLIAQLKKDFTLANVAIKISTGIAPTAFKKQLEEKIYFLLLENFDEYLNVLYVIDVPEKEFKHIRMTDVVDVAKQVSLLILKRELQKVWYKAN